MQLNALAIFILVDGFYRPCFFCLKSHFRLSITRRLCGNVALPQCLSSDYVNNRFHW